MRQDLPTLLVIADEPQIAAFVTEAASGLGFAVLSCTNPHKIEPLLEPEPNVILLDLAMPSKDGVAVLRELADRGCRSRIVLISGFDPGVLEIAARIARVQGLHICGHLVKPIRLEKLKSLLLELDARPLLPAGADLARGMAAGELLLHYQPQVALATGLWSGVEVLVRWQHPVRGMVDPDHFIPTAEAHGLVLDLTRRVLAMAIEAVVTDAAFAGFDGVLSVNLSLAALKTLDFPEEILALCQRWDFPAKRLMFELTETSVPEDPLLAEEILARLRSHGFSLSLDDYGTGLSNLRRLSLLPFNEMKIDKNYVLAAQVDPLARQTVLDHLALGRQFGLQVIAEGVEDQWTYDWLEREGCDMVQGWYISKAKPLNEFRAWAAAWSNVRPG